MLDSRNVDSNPSAERRDDGCNLPTEEFQDRLAMIRRDILPLAKRREELTDGLAFEFEQSPGMKKTLEDFIAFERECCSGLTGGLEQTEAAQLRLSIRGLSPSSEFFQTVGGTTATPRSEFVRRIAQSLGLGVGTALLVCCIAPIALAAIVGASVAAPFAKLDNPATIALASVTTAAAAWFWLKRRARKAACEC